MALPSHNPDNCDEPYAVIKFDEKNEDGNYVIDLVPKIWLHTRGNRKMCKFPPAKEHGQLEEFIKQRISPRKSWSSYAYEFVIGAANIAQGLNRLDKARYTKECESTDIEKKQSMTVLPRSKSKVNQLLGQKIPMPSPEHATSITSQKSIPKGRRSHSRFHKIRPVISDSDTDHEEECHQRARIHQRSKIMSPKNLFAIGRKEPEDDDNLERLLKNYKEHKIINSSTPSSTSFRSTSNQYGSSTKSPKLSSLCTQNNLKATDGKRKLSCTSDSTSQRKSPDKYTSPRTPQRRSRSMPRDSSVSPITKRFKGSECHGGVTDWEHIKNSIFGELKEYFDKKMDSLRDKVRYDVRTSCNELKTTIVGANLAAAKGPFEMSAKNCLSAHLPFKELEDFLEYENVLTNDEDELRALILFYKILIGTNDRVSSIIRKLMTATLCKNVEINYSGFGRGTHAYEAKKNFGDTKVFAAMHEAIRSTLGVNKETEKLQSRFSLWLAGVGDRDGGRKDRRSGARRRSKST